MPGAQIHNVRFEPVGVEMEVEEGETVLNAAFRQGISLMHGCKEGQCGSCKSRLVDGDIELLKYSTFALPDYESETGHVLLCRTHVFSDVSFELLNYDEDLLSRSIAVKEFAGRLAKISALTHDIRLLEIEIDKPLKFWAGQYVDLTLPDRSITRAFSMANAPGDGARLSASSIILRDRTRASHLSVSSARVGHHFQPWRQADRTASSGYCASHSI